MPLHTFEYINEDQLLTQYLDELYGADQIFGKESTTLKQDLELYDNLRAIRVHITKRESKQRYRRISNQKKLKKFQNNQKLRRLQQQKSSKYSVYNINV